MVSKCANPDCSATFHYLRDGKLFQLEVGTPTGPQLVSRKPHKLEHFWLCGECAPLLTLAVEPGGRVVTVPVQRALRRAAAS